MRQGVQNGNQVHPMHLRPLSWILISLVVGSSSILQVWGQTADTHRLGLVPSGGASAARSESNEASPESQARDQASSLTASIDGLTTRAALLSGKGKLKDAAEVFGELAVEDAISSIRSREDAAAVEQLAAAQFDLGARGKGQGILPLPRRSLLRPFG